MIDPEIKNKIETLKTHVSEINKIIEELYKKGVDIQLTFDTNINGKNNTSPSLALWRATAKIDYI